MDSSITFIFEDGCSTVVRSDEELTLKGGKILIFECQHGFYLRIESGGPAKEEDAHDD